MELFRITRAEYQNDLTGIGAYRHGGRWNTPQNSMLYTSSRRSLAMLEIIVHCQQPNPPENFVVVVLFVPDNAPVYNPYPLMDWQEDQQWSKETGDSWLKANNTLLMSVPSVVVPSEKNYLINPLHADFGSVKVINTEPFTFDKRLFL
jgi:RES domain-containing protein